jgi:hypothetical protein
MMYAFQEAISQNSQGRLFVGSTGRQVVTGRQLFERFIGIEQIPFLLSEWFAWHIGWGGNHCHFPSPDQKERRLYGWR